MNLGITAKCAGSRRHYASKLLYTAQDPLASEKKTAIAAAGGAAAGGGGGGGGGGGNSSQALVAAIKKKNKVRGGYEGARAR